jgi:predicted tellurium resistance membrane protein TerC
MGRKKERHIDTNNVYCQNIFNEKMILQKLDNSSVSLQRGLIVGAIITVVLRIIITIITSRLEKHDRYRMQLIGLYNL